MRIWAKLNLNFGLSHRLLHSPFTEQIKSRAKQTRKLIVLTMTINFYQLTPTLFLAQRLFRNAIPPYSLLKTNLSIFMLRSVSERLKLWCLNVQIAFFPLPSCCQFDRMEGARLLFFCPQIYVKMRSLKLWNIFAVVLFPPKSSRWATLWFAYKSRKTMKWLSEISV